MTQININVNNQPMSVISPISLSELIALKQLKDEGTAVGIIPCGDVPELACLVLLTS